MKFAHLADLHLGFRQFDRANKAGANQREADVAEALKRAVDGVLAAGVDAVLLAGDLFHQVRPPNSAILQMFAQLQRLRAAGLPLLAIAGDHDTPRTAETTPILGLYRALDMQVALQRVERFSLEGVTVTAVPVVAARQVATLEPVPGVRNVLLAHGEARGFEGGNAIDATAFARWDYVALGHYHVATKVRANAWYAGSLDYASSNPWGELGEEAKHGLPGKGWLLVTLGEGAPIVEFQPIDPPRRVLDLQPIDATDMTEAQLNAALAERLVVPELAGSWARLVVENLSRLTQRGLDHTALRVFKAAALNLQIEWRRPAAQAPSAERAARMRRQSLEQTVEGFLTERTLPEDVDRERLRALGQAFLATAAGLPDPYTGEPVTGVA